MDYSELIAAADASIFTDSISSWIGGISINSVVMLIMMIFMIVGAIDRIRGNKLGYGEKFEDGFNAIGGLAIAMAGVYAAAPVLSMVLGPIISPIYTAIGADASMFATTILACDMGGYPLAMELASDPSIGNFAGLILGTMMGPTIVFTIPVALGIISTAKILDLLMTRHPRPTYLVILGFMLASVLSVFPGVPGGLEILICLATFLAGFLVILRLSKL